MKAEYTFSDNNLMYCSSDFFLVTFDMRWSLCHPLCGYLLLTRRVVSRCCYRRYLHARRVVRRFATGTLSEHFAVTPRIRDAQIKCTFYKQGIEVE